MAADPAAYAILTNPAYRSPTVLPDGQYKAETFTIETYTQVNKPMKRQRVKMKASYSKTIKTLSILGLCFVCAIQAEEPESPALKILEFHGIRATDPGGAYGVA